jgi:hypothetical protein
VHEALRLLSAALDKWNQGNPNRMPVAVIDEFDLLGKNGRPYSLAEVVRLTATSAS